MYDGECGDDEESDGGEGDDDLGPGFLVLCHCGCVTSLFLYVSRQDSNLQHRCHPAGKAGLHHPFPLTKGLSVFFVAMTVAFYALCKRLSSPPSANSSVGFCRYVGGASI